MGDSLLERASRYHGGFVDSDGKSELVSSITKKLIHIQGVAEAPKVKQEREDVPPTKPDDSLFYMKAWGSMLAIAIVTACVFYRWMVSSKSRKNGTNMSEWESCSSETSSTGLPSRNLSDRFEEVKDSNPRTRAPVQERQYECVETEEVCSPRACPEAMIPGGGSQSGRGFGVKEVPVRFRRHNSQVTAPRATCPSPPSLVDEDSPNSEQLNNQHSLVSATPTTQPSPLGCDASSLFAINKHSHLDQTPQKLVLDFCRSCDVIEQELTRSKRKLDASSVHQLALLHQSSQMKERHLKQKISIEARRESFLTVKKLDEWRIELTKIRNECLSNIWGAIRGGLIVIVLFEALRFGSNIKESLELFSWHFWGEQLLKEACGCEQDAGFEAGDNASAQSNFSLATSMLRMAAFGLDSSLTSRILSYSSTSLCVLSYVVYVGMVLLLHASLSFMRLPAFVHHLFHMVVLILCLAQDPQVMVKIDSLLQRYALFAKAQAVITVASFAMALLGFSHVDQSIVEHQNQVRGGRADCEDATSKARSKIAKYALLSVYSQWAPPVIVGLLALWKEKGW